MILSHAPMKATRWPPSVREMCVYSPPGSRPSGARHLENPRADQYAEQRGVGFERAEVAPQATDEDCGRASIRNTRASFVLNLFLHSLSTSCFIQTQRLASFMLN